MKIFILFFYILLTSCTSVSFTERKQIMLLGDDVIYPQAFKAYKDFKKEAELISEGENYRNIIEIKDNMKSGIKNYYKMKNLPDPTANFDWEVVLVKEDDVKNAWCMPGGKIAVYSGILGIADNKNGIAAIMGHEIAHAVARHGSERASQAVFLDMATMALEGLVIGRPLSSQSRRLYQYFTTFGIMLPFSRSHEVEADYLGLIFMHFSGYDLSEAVKVWERMSEDKSASNRVPQFLSTHPSSKNRIKNIKSWIPEIKEKFKEYESIN